MTTQSTDTGQVLKSSVNRQAVISILIFFVYKKIESICRIRTASVQMILYSSNEVTWLTFHSVWQFPFTDIDTAKNVFRNTSVTGFLISIRDKVEIDFLSQKQIFFKLSDIKRFEAEILYLLLVWHILH